MSGPQSRELGVVEVRLPALLVDEAERLAKAVAADDVGPEARIRDAQVDGLVGESQQLVAERLRHLVDLILQTRDHPAGEKLHHGVLPRPVQVVVDGAEAAADG